MVYATIHKYLENLSDQARLKVYNIGEESNRRKYLKLIEWKIVNLLGILPEEVELWKNIKISPDLVMLANRPKLCHFSLKMIKSQKRKKEQYKKFISLVSITTMKTIAIYFTKAQVEFYWELIQAISTTECQLREKKEIMKKEQDPATKEDIKKQIKPIKKSLSKLEARQNNFEEKAKADKRAKVAKRLNDILSNPIPVQKNCTGNQQTKKSSTISVADLTDYRRLTECFKEPNTYSDEDLKTIGKYKKNRFGTLFLTSVETTLVDHQIFHGRTAVSVLNGTDGILNKLIQVKDMNMERLIAFMLRTSVPRLVPLKEFIKNNVTAFESERREEMLTSLELINEQAKNKWNEEQINTFLWALIVTNDFWDGKAQKVKEDALKFLQNEKFLGDFQYHINEERDDNSTLNNSVETTLVEIFNGRTAVGVLNGTDGILNKLIQVNDMNMEQLIAFMLRTSVPRLVPLKEFIKDNAQLDTLPLGIQKMIFKAFNSERLKDILTRILTRLKRINEKAKYKWTQINTFLWSLLVTNDFWDFKAQKVKEDALKFLQNKKFLRYFQRRISLVIDEGRDDNTPLNKKIYYDSRYRKVVICKNDDNGNLQILYSRHVWQNGRPQAGDIMKSCELEMSKNVSCMYSMLRKCGEKFCDAGLEITSVPKSMYPIRSRYVNKRLGEKVRRLVLDYNCIQGKPLTFKSVDKLVHHVVLHPQSKVYPNFNPMSLFEKYCKKGGEWIVSAPTVNFALKDYGLIVYFHNGSGIRDFFADSRDGQNRKRRSRKSRDADNLPYDENEIITADKPNKLAIKKLALLISETGEITVNTFF